MIDEVYQQPFLNKLSNTLKLFEKQFYQNSTNYQTTWSYPRSSSIKIINRMTCEDQKSWLIRQKFSPEKKTPGK